MSAATQELQRGVCRYCGCTDQVACTGAGLGGCFWIDEEHTTCSGAPCVEKFFDEQYEIAKQALERNFAALRGVWRERTR